jgi:hypothetical protein
LAFCAVLGAVFCVLGTLTLLLPLTPAILGYGQLVVGAMWLGPAIFFLVRRFASPS